MGDELNSNHGLGLQRPSIIHGTQPPPYSTSVSGSGIDNKGVDTSLKDSDDNLKAHLYGNGSTSVHHVGGHHGGYGGVHHVHDAPHSNSNSANGGSVNSQDSLWNVKGAPAMQSQDPAMMHMMNAYQMQTQGYNVYDAIAMQQQQQQQPQPQQLQQYPEDYTHYPHPEEYLNERNQ